MKSALTRVIALAALALAACAAPAPPTAQAPPTSIPVTIDVTQTPAATATAAPSPVPATATPAETPTSEAGTGAAFQPLAAEACAELAQAMSAKLGASATQGDAAFNEPGTSRSGDGCQATITGTGEQFAAPATVIQELTAVLEAEGWAEDTSLASGGPTGAGAGFRKNGDVCLASANWQPGPEVQCPADQPISACEVPPEKQVYTITLNCAQPAQATAGLANPASENCVAQGGTVSIEKRGDGGEYGVCVFEDNMQCEEWAMLRGECPVGGVRVTGYVTDAARYCAITGGTYAVTGNSNTPQETGTCTLAGGKVCDATEYFNGACTAGS
jgi:putative hemolysin